MQKALKVGGGIALAMGAVLLTIYVVAVYVVDDRFYLQMVREAVKDSTGLTIDISGQFKVERSLRPGLVAEDVRLSNPGMGTAAEIVRVKHLRFQIELIPLLRGDLRFAVTMEQPQIRLQVNATGRRNWQVGEVSESPRGETGTDSGWDLVIDHVEIFDGRLMYRDARDDSNVEVTLATFELQHDRAAGLATLGFLGAYQDTQYSINGTLRDPAADEPLRAELTIDAYGPGASADRNAPATLHLTASGTVSRLDQDPAFDLAVDGRMQTLLPLTKVLGVKSGAWTQLGPVAVRTRLQLKRGAYHLKDVDAKWTPDGLALMTTGTVSDLGGANELDLALSATAETLTKLSQVPALPKIAFPQIGSVQANGRLRGSQGSFRIDDLRARLETDALDVQVAGTVTDLDGEPEARFDVTTRISDLSQVSAVFGLETNLPPVGPIQAKGILQRSEGEYQIQNFDAVWEQPGVRATVTGNEASVLPTPTMAMQLELQADSLEALSALSQRELPAVGPVSLKSKLVLDSDQVRASELQLQVGGSDLSGQVSLNRKQRPTPLTAKLSSRVLNLDQLLDTPAQSDAEREQTKNSQEKTDVNEAETAQSARPDSEEQPWLPTEPLNLSWLELWQGLVDVRVDQMIQDVDTFDDVVVQVQLKPGILYVPTMRMKLNDGELSLNVGIDANQSPPTFHYRNEAKDIDIGSLLNLPSGVITGGKTTGTVELFSTGSSPAEIMSNLNGYVLLRMGEARIVEAGLASASSALLGGMLSGVSQTEDGEPYTDYQCGVFGFNFKDGIVTMRRSIALQSKRFNVGGSGQVDLNKGTIHLELRPRARKGLGISAAMLTGGFKISGKLDMAEAGLSMKGLLESYLLSSTAALLVATPAGGVATGAVLTLRGIWDRVTAGTFSCKNTLKRIERQNSGG